MSDDSRRRLEDVLDREIEAVRAFQTLLAAERDALTGASPEHVEKHAADKVALLNVIEKLEAERRTLAGAAEQSLPGAGAPRDAGLSASVGERWQTLMDAAKKCRLANQANGYIINTRQGQIRQLLGIIRGASPLTYSPQGKALAKAQRALAKA
jgi:flagellar biosynthesis/type III secretory pathway chaperone